MPTQPQARCFVIMPFGHKQAADGTDIDFDRVYELLLRPAVEAAGLQAHRADMDRRGGSIHADMFQDLLLAEFVVADLTLDNANVWYEIGVRHALRASGSVLTYALRDRLPFDLAGQRMMRHTLTAGVPDPAKVDAERAALTEAITATLGAWRGRKASPVYAQLPNLQEPDWKTLKVGDTNEFWQALEAWQSRIRVAQDRQRPGDILVLAEETPNHLLAFEALRMAAEALSALKRPRYALSVLECALAIAPDDVTCRRLQAIALGRLGRFDEAREALRRLAGQHRDDQHRDGETAALLARTWKDQWRRLWQAHPSRATDPIGAARDTAATLVKAAEAYHEAFCADPAGYYPGINALTLGRVCQGLVGRCGSLDLPLIAAGVRWAAECALLRERTYWPLATRAELALMEGQTDAALADYGEAAALAIAAGDGFALDSSCQTLDMLQALNVQPEGAAAARRVLDSAEQQLAALSGGRLWGPAEPARVVLFSGHMVDRPDRATPRFPEALVPAAGERIVRALTEIGAGPGDLGIAQAASGGDLLFAQACLARGMRLEIYLSRDEPAFLADSVQFAATHWQEDFDGLKNRPDVLFRIMPDDLGPAPEGVDVYDRCSRWTLHTALSCGLTRVSFIALWDGKPGDGPGGTESMVSLVRKLTGRQPLIIDPGSL